MTVKTFLWVLLIIPSLTLAGVNPKNGNFYISYGDITQEKDEHELNISRAYNSKAAREGWFGYGWGSEYETRLTALPDGSAAITENGSGKISYYRPTDSADIAGGVEKIIETIVKTDHITEAEVVELRQKLLSDENLRLQKVESYGLNLPLPINTTLQGFNCQANTVTRVAEGYKRTDSERGIEEFDLQGHLIRKVSLSGYTVTINYEGNRPTVIKDSVGQSLNFKWTANGQVESITGAKNTAQYTYDDKSNLIKFNDTNGNGNAYEYEYGQNHNLTAVVYLNNRRMTMSYDANSAATSVTDIDGSKQIYDYLYDPKDSLHYWTKITYVRVTGESNSQEYEYKNRVNANGTEWTRQIIRSQDGRFLDETFDEKGRTTYQVNADNEQVIYEHDERCGKLLGISQKSKSGRKYTIFKYNEFCELVDVRKSNGEGLRMKYVKNSRKNGSSLVASVITQSRFSNIRLLRFKYNKQRLPIEISLMDVGKIKVRYDSHGNIIRMSSSGGEVTRLEITTALQHLQNLVKPTDISLSM